MADDSTKVASGMWRSARAQAAARQTSRDITRQAERPFTASELFKGPENRAITAEDDNKLYMRNLGKQIPRENKRAMRQTAKREMQRFSQRKNGKRK